jgi:AMMECR1 domain-containing protein
MMRLRPLLIAGCAAAAGASLTAGTPLDTLGASPTARREALMLARCSLETIVTGKCAIPRVRSSIARIRCGAFVILVLKGTTRACAGTLRPTTESAGREIVAAAAMAAAGDPWHAPLQARDLARGRVEVCLAGPPVPLRSITELNVARDGLLVQSGPRSAVILPGEARTASWALREARRKAGLRPSERADLFRFSAIRWRGMEPSAGKSRNQPE